MVLPENGTGKERKAEDEQQSSRKHARIKRNNVVASQEVSALSAWTGHPPWIERSFGDLVGH